MPFTEKTLSEECARQKRRGESSFDSATYDAVWHALLKVLETHFQAFKGISIPHLGKVTWRRETGIRGSVLQPVFLLNEATARARGVSAGRAVPPSSSDLVIARDLNYAEVAIRYSGLPKDVVTSCCRHLMDTLWDAVASGQDVRVRLAVGVLAARERKVEFTFDGSYHKKSGGSGGSGASAPSGGALVGRDGATAAAVASVPSPNTKEGTDRPSSHMQGGSANGRPTQSAGPSRSRDGASSASSSGGQQRAGSRPVASAGASRPSSRLAAGGAASAGGSTMADASSAGGLQMRGLSFSKAGSAPAQAPPSVGRASSAGGSRRAPSVKGSSASNASQRGQSDTSRLAAVAEDGSNAALRGTLAAKGMAGPDPFSYDAGMVLGAVAEELSDKMQRAGGLRIKAHDVVSSMEHDLTNPALREAYDRYQSEVEAREEEERRKEEFIERRRAELNSQAARVAQERRNKEREYREFLKQQALAKKQAEKDQTGQQKNDGPVPMGKPADIQARIDRDRARQKQLQYQSALLEQVREKQERRESEKRREQQQTEQVLEAIAYSMQQSKEEAEHQKREELQQLQAEWELQKRVRGGMHR
eukprot:jgi/Mesvir1/17840/Mv12928-RA.2